MKQSLTLIKLGGSIITEKDTPKTVRLPVLHRLIAEIAHALHENPKVGLIVGHGSGSFAHNPAHKYQTMHGFSSEEGKLGMAITQDCAAELNRIIVGACIAQGIPAVTLAASNLLVTKSHAPHHWCDQVMREYLHQGLIPITYGDVIVDRDQGCTIWSTEEVLGVIAKSLHHDTRHIVTKVIHVTEVPGVLDQQGGIIPKITPDTVHHAKKSIGITKGTDVTGGMGHKVDESIQLVQQGIEVAILSGLVENNLYNAMVGKAWIGTTITDS